MTTVIEILDLLDFGLFVQFGVMAVKKKGWMTFYLNTLKVASLLFL